MGRKRKWRTNAERQKAYRQRNALANGKLVDTESSRQHLIEVVPDIIPEYVDTCQWTWKKWALYFLGIQLEWFQESVLQALEEYMRVTNRLPRDSGKTIIINRIFTTRKLCESGLPPKTDINICYVSNGKDNVIDFVLMVAADLMENEKIIQNYGNLLDVPSQKEALKLAKIKPKSRRQTQMILNLGHRKDLFNPSLFGTTIRGVFRGKGFHYAIIDDPVDIFHTENPRTARLLTKKIMNYIKNKLYPRVPNISVTGTRYDTDGHDIFTQLSSEMGGRIWKTFEYKTVNRFGDYHIRDTTREITPADIIIDHPEEWELFSQFIWELKAEKLRAQGIECSGLQYAVYMYATMEKRYFFQEYQNEPQALKAQLSYDLLNDYQVLPSGAMKWGVFVDLSSGESRLSDYTGITLVGRHYQNYYIHDLSYGRWTGKQKLQKLEAFMQKAVNDLDVDIRHIKLMIETVLGQRDFFQRVRDESALVPQPISPARRGDKETRITHGFGQEVENGNVYLYVNCRNKSRLRSEMDSFPGGEHEHIIDSIDQNIYHLKYARGLPFSGRTSSEFKFRS